MEAQHMTQQVFADFLGIAPATLSGIFNDRTKPTINIVEAIKRKLPVISTDWLMFGTGQMYLDASAPSPTPEEEKPSSASLFQDSLFDFEQSARPKAPTAIQPSPVPPVNRSAQPEMKVDYMKNQDKTTRKVTEIRVFYDDQTWESFVPAKK